MYISRLKGAFKAVMAEIKTLSDETLTKFVDGGDLVVQGHKLQSEDIRWADIFRSLQLRILSLFVF